MLLSHRPDFLIYFLFFRLQATKHTIILLQHTGSFETRSYLDFQSVNAAMDGVVKLYEHKLKQLNPSVPDITYDLSDLNSYLDSLYDISALV
jgi:hypothetical protein